MQILKILIYSKFSLILTFALFPVVFYSDELDDIIRFALSNSIMSHSLTNNIEIAKLRHDQIWFSIIPEASISANYTYQNNEPNTNYSITLGISKNFGDIDSSIQQFRIAENDYKSSKIDQELDKINFINSIIVNYIDLSEIIHQKEIYEQEISNDFYIYNIVLFKVKTGSEDPSALVQYSNEIHLKSDDLELDKYDFSSRIDKFTQITATNPVLYQLNNLTESDYNNIVSYIKISNQLFSSISKKNIEISNNLILLSKKNREILLPTLGLSASLGFDFLAGRFNYGYGTSLSYPIFDLFKKFDDIKIYALQISNINIDISNKIKEVRNNIRLVDNEEKTLQQKISFLDTEIKIESELQNGYFNDYQMGKIDFYDFKKRKQELILDELELIHSKALLFRLHKRLQYGILVQD